MNDIVILRKKTLYVRKDYYIVFNVNLLNHYIKKSMMYIKTMINPQQLHIYDDGLKQIFNINGMLDVYYYRTNILSLDAMISICANYGFDGLLKFLLYEDYGYIKFKDKRQDFYYRLKKLDPKNDLLKVVNIDKMYLDEYYITFEEPDKLLNLPYFSNPYRLEINKFILRIVDV